MEVAKAIDHFMANLQSEGRSDFTRRAYVRHIRKLEKWLGANAQVESVSFNMLIRFLSSEPSTSGPCPVTPSRRNLANSSIRAFFKYLERAGHIRDNPARLIRNHRTEPKPPEHLRSAEVRALFSALRRSHGPTARRDCMLFSLLLGTGLRLGSLVKVQVSNLDLKRRYIRIKAKGGVDRKAHFNSNLGRRLKTYITASGFHSEDPLFPSRKGGHLSCRQVQLRFKYWLEKAGVDRRYTVHSLRHTFAMNLYQKTGDLRLVQTALGHKRITTTEIYARADDRRLKRALEKL
jgi:integrase/recombinase XerC